MGSLMHVLPSLFIPPKHIHLKRELAPAVQEVCRCLDVDLTGQTSASFNMRQNYERCLFQFEDYLASGAYVADVNAGRAPSAEAIAPFVCRHSIAQLPAPGEIGAPRRIPPPEREPSEPKSVCLLVAVNHRPVIALSSLVVPVALPQCMQVPMLSVGKVVQGPSPSDGTCLDMRQQHPKTAAAAVLSKTEF
jgi:hypothetical protein